MSDPKDALLIKALRRIEQLEEERKRTRDVLERVAAAMLGAREMADVIDEMLALPGPWEAATKARSGGKRQRRARAVELKATGLNPTQIGVRMGREDKKRNGQAFDRRTVERWLAEERSDISG